MLLSLAALWILARIRFPERPSTPNPVAPLLTQIAPRIAFEDLERAVFEVEPDLSLALNVLPTERRLPGGSSRRESLAALRFRADAVLALIDGAAVAAGAGVTEAARDRATDLAVLRTPASTIVPLKTWTPTRSADYPRYLIVGEVWRDRPNLRPLYFGPLYAVTSPAWSAEVWSVPPHVEVRPGSFLFTTRGALVGLVAGAPGDAVIVPAEVAISTAERLLAEQPRRPGWLGVEVQPLTGPLQAATGVASGVAVTWVSPQGPAAGKLVATDVVQSLGNQAIGSSAEWAARVARLAEGDGVSLRIQRAGRSIDVQLTAAPPPAAPVSPRLGVTLRHRRGVGSEVLGVEEGSVAMRAGIRAGDILTRIGELDAPTPSQVGRAFAGSADRGVLVAITRGGGHLVISLGER